jgi:dipeptidyl aminopeptidase/acylaminoacyl peptidase
VIDLEGTLRDALGGLAPFVGNLLVNSPYQRSLKHLSPKFHVDKDCVPTLFLTGDKDNLNLYPQSQDYTWLLHHLGVDARLFTAAGKDHGFTWNYWEPESVGSVQAIVEFFDRYLK